MTMMTTTELFPRMVRTEYRLLPTNGVYHVFGGVSCNKWCLAKSCGPDGISYVVDAMKDPELYHTRADAFQVRRWIMSIKDILRLHGMGVIVVDCFSTGEVFETMPVGIPLHHGWMLERSNLFSAAAATRTCRVYSNVRRLAN